MGVYSLCLENSDMVLWGLAGHTKLVLGWENKRQKKRKKKKKRKECVLDYGQMPVPTKSNQTLGLAISPPDTSILICIVGIYVKGGLVQLVALP